MSKFKIHVQHISYGWCGLELVIGDKLIKCNAGYSGPNPLASLIEICLDFLTSQKEGYENSTETGSGWLTALAQTGLIGFSLICFLVYKVKLTLNDLRTDSTAALFEAVMLFLLLHSFFEAYMFQIGWYMCLFFWLLLSVLDDYKTYDTMPDMETELFGESINDH